MYVGVYFIQELKLEQLFDIIFMLMKERGT